MSPLVIVAIHMSEHAELLIRFREQGPHFPVTDLSTRLVAVYGTDYKHKATFERDVTGKRLSNFTSRIITDSKNNIYVLDWFDVDHQDRSNSNHRYEWSENICLQRMPNFQYKNNRL